MIKTRPASAAKAKSAAAGIVERMADAMREMVNNGVPVTVDNLAAHTEFTRAEISNFAGAAADFAKQRAREAA